MAAAATLNMTSQLALKLIVELQELNYMTQSGIPKVCQGVADIISAFSTELEEACAVRDPQLGVIVRSETSRILTANSLSRFSSEKKILKYMEQECRMISPQDTKLGEKYAEKFTGDVSKIVLTEAFACVVPFKLSLEMILSNKELLSYIQNPVKPSTDGLIRNVKDGSIWKNHPVCKLYPDCLLFALYEDDVEVTNPLGSKTKMHKTTNVYWSLLNIPEHLRSNLKSILLCGLAKSIDVKEFGFGALLSDFLDNIKKLESAEGLKLNVNGVETVFHGALLEVCGDGLALNGIGGFKESFSFAFRPCRNCSLTKEEMQNIFYEHQLRDRLTHERQLTEITSSSLTNAEKDKLSKEYGVVCESVFAGLENFDVTKNLPQDSMHNILEGVVEVEVKAFLKHLLAVDESFNMDDLNARLRSFPYPSELVGDKPSSIDANHLEAKLRQSAAQMHCLLIILPFIVPACKCEVTCKYQQNYVLLIKIVHKLFAYELNVKSLNVLRFMIRAHHERFKSLYENVTITPKFHFMVHAPTVIEQYGPNRVTWCMRYEARNAWFSRVAKTSRNFKNIVKSLSKRFQLRNCIDYGYGDPNFVVLGDKKFSFDKENKADLQNYSLAEKVCESLGVAVSTIVVQPQEIYFNNIMLKIGSVVKLKGQEDVPLFCKICAFFVSEDKVVFTVHVLETVCFDEERCAYEVRGTNTFTCARPEHLETVQTFPSIKLDNQLYVIPMYYDLKEFVG